jgi:hypothetical protein
MGTMMVLAGDKQLTVQVQEHCTHPWSRLIIVQAVHVTLVLLAQAVPQYLAPDSSAHRQHTAGQLHSAWLW